tara:strand:+ start:67 stop:264 length:198 start_codon:yes stop_codon:yes gene_type:complete
MYDVLFDDIAAHIGAGIVARNAEQSVLYWHGEEPEAVAREKRLDAAWAKIDSGKLAMIALVLTYW